MAVNSAARIWSPYKELYHTVAAAVIHKQPDAIQDLEVILRRHKPDFISLLKNPAKNEVHKAAVKKANVEGLPVQGRQAPQVLTEQFIQEALIISDLFQLNEFAAVELLIAAENQQPFFPGLTRGLVAVLLYYDGKTSVVSALRALIQSRQGRTWTMGLPDDLVTMATKFTDQLLQEGLVARILELLTTLDVNKDMAKLQEQRALGTARHRKQVLDKMQEIRQTLAECLFAWSCQTALGKADTLRLIQHLKTCESTAADGSLDDVTLTLLMTLLYSVDVRILEQEDAEDIIQAQPVVREPDFLLDIHTELTAPQDWKIPGLKSVAQLAWAVALRTLPQYYNPPGAADCYEQDESVAEFCISEGVFSFLRHAVVASAKFHNEKFYVMQIHNLITDFMVQMPLKVKELRNAGDESARIIVANQQEGLEPPANLPRHFEHLMLLIGDLYAKDPLGLELGLEFWCPPEPTQQQISASGFASMYNYRPPQRQISLYKFVRLAGDLLPPPLFVPYLDMLCGLATGPQCAHHCYNLLKNNGSTAGGHASPVSWDHFFLSMNQYYTNLRQENAPASDMVHVYRGHHLKGITAQELEGLSSVLKLTQIIASQGEFARVALCENQQWLPLVVLLGLVGCSVPTILKAELLKTLAALAKTPEIAANLWQSIEVSQILPTIPTSSLRAAPGGIQVELDEVEARNEDFPMTLAFLQLLDTLTDSPIPAGLGAGYRAPGFQPYLDFLRDYVLLKFNTRAYKDPAQKWEVAASVLHILHKLLDGYEVMYEDFVEQQVELAGEGIITLNKPPGYSLMLHMLNDTPMLKMTLYIVDESSKLLDKFIDFPGHAHLEKASLLCLQLLQSTLQKQERYLAGLRETGASTMVSQLDKLLMGINPRSGKADHIVNVAKYVTYNAHLPQHALAAVQVLQAVCQSPLVQPKLVSLLTASADLEQRVLHGFVECIECDEPEELSQYVDITDEDPSEAQVRCATRQHIVRLLLGALDHPAPNIAHYLLGFELSKPVSKTNLQDPGVLNAPRTCLHAVLSLLDKGVGSRTGPTCLQDTPRLAELGYRLVYSMCANRDTSTPSLRYLRTTRDFLFRHLQHVPFHHLDEKRDSGALLGHQSWLLRAVALELKLTSANKQRSHTQRLMNLLLDDNPGLNQRGPDGVYEPEFSQYESEFSLYTSQVSQQPGLMGGQSRRKILAILDSIDFAQDFDSSLDLEFFNPGDIEQVLKSVEERTQDGVLQGNVRLCMKLLMNEINAQGSGSGQRQLHIAEVRGICARLVERNAYREAIHTKKEAFESWRQVLEILLTACPADLLCGELRQSVLFAVLQELLVKVAKEDAVPELAARVAGVILTLMANLRQCFLTDQPEGLELGHGSQYISLLDGTLPPSANQGSAFGGVSGGRTLYASSLQVVLRGLVEYLMRSSSGSQRVRANLYGALLYYLQIAQKPALLPGDTSKSVGARVTSGEAEYEKLEAENMATIASYGDTFMEVVCRDACDGHDVGRMLAMATVDTILTMDRHGDWLQFMTSRGYLQHVIGSVLQDDEQLQQMLHPSPEPLRALYIFESKMGLLTRVAERATGAHTLLQCGLMSRLAECTIFDMRPEGVDSSDDSFIPSVLNRYRKQILFPILKLCVAVLTSLGIENKQAASKVLQFIIAHIDVFTGILRERHPVFNVDALKELALTSGVVGRAALDDVECDGLLGDTAAIEFKGHVMRLQRQMIALLPKFCLSDKMFKQVKSMELRGSVEEQETRLQLQVSLVEISCNVIAFCRTIITRSGTGASNLYRILFGPALDEALMQRDYYSHADDYQPALSTAAYPQNLGLVVFMLRQATEHFLCTLDEQKVSEGKLERVLDLSAEELRELCGGEQSDKLSSQQRQSIARRRLLHIIAYKTQELQLFSYIIENCLLIVWRHLDYYLLRCEPTESATSLYKTHAHKLAMRRLNEVPGSPMSTALRVDEDIELPSGVSRQELETLKQDSVHCLNDSLFKKLREIEQCYTKQRNRYGFMEALVRRIKRLLTLHTAAS